MQHVEQGKAKQHPRATLLCFRCEVHFEFVAAVHATGRRDANCHKCGNSSIAGAGDSDTT